MPTTSIRLEITHCTHIVIWKIESYRSCEIVEPGITVMNQNREDSRVHIVLFTLPTSSTLTDMINKFVHIIIYFAISVIQQI